MKRDMNLVREILIALSEANEPINASAFTSERYNYDISCLPFSDHGRSWLGRGEVFYVLMVIHIIQHVLFGWRGKVMIFCHLLHRIQYGEK